VSHFISLTDCTTDQIVALLDRADYLAEAWRRGTMPATLAKKKIALWFFGNGFRNRVAFEIGAKAMGASVSFIPGELGIDEPLEDVGHYLSNWFSALVIRARKHEDTVKLASDLEIPLINARTDYNHPCEILGDLQFVRRHRGSIEGAKVAFVGEVTNLCMSWFEAAVRFPMEVVQVAPPGYVANEALVKSMNNGASGKIGTTFEIGDALRGADLVYTDCWPRASTPEQKEEVKRAFLPYQITAGHLSGLKRKAMFLPCPPVTRGQEVSRDAMESPLCLDYAAKEYLLHSQNALMEMIIGGPS
jgi:ornithine carbamoyltransferase